MSDKPVPSKKAPPGPLAAVVLMLTVPGVSYYEGKIPHTHADPVDIPSFCYGHTGEDVVPGRVAKEGECERLRDDRIMEAFVVVFRCTGSGKTGLLPRHYAAFSSFEYNVGSSAFCSSTLAQLAKEGRVAEACAQLSRWKYATYFGRKIELPGLVNRRAGERMMCEQGKWPKEVQ